MTNSKARAVRPGFINLKQQYITYEGAKGFRLNLHLNLKSPGVNWIMGENGAGKSTLLNLLCGAIPYKFGYEFQQYQLGTTGTACLLSGGGYFDHLTLYDHFKFLTKALDLPKVESDRCLQQWQLFHLRNKKLSQLSTGQVNKALLAMCTINNPHTVLLDEPEKALDDSGHQILKATLDKWRKQQRTIVICTHGNQAIRSTDNIVLLRQGVALFNGPIDSMLNRLGEESYGPIVYIKKLLDQ